MWCLLLLHLMFELHCAEWCMCRVWHSKAVFTFIFWRGKVSLCSPEISYLDRRTHEQDFVTSHLHHNCMQLTLHKCDVEMSLEMSSVQQLHFLHIHRFWIFQWGRKSRCKDLLLVIELFCGKTTDTYYYSKQFLDWSSWRLRQYAG